jgi:hypothetical protein
MSASKLGTPATYRIAIIGRLDRSWSAQLGGMDIRVEHESERQAVTVLTGRLVDQAALFGVLNAVYGLGFALLSVERMEKGKEE